MEHSSTEESTEGNEYGYGPWLFSRPGSTRAVPSRRRTPSSAARTCKPKHKRQILSHTWGDGAGDIEATLTFDNTCRLLAGEGAAIFFTRTRWRGCRGRGRPVERWRARPRRPCAGGCATSSRRQPCCGSWASPPPWSTIIAVDAPSFPLLLHPRAGLDPHV